MSRCEDYPCCGHAPGECPERYERTGRVLCVDCGRRPAIRFGRCYSCAAMWQRRLRRHEPDLTGQDAECFV